MQRRNQKKSMEKKKKRKTHTTVTDQTQKRLESCRQTTSLRLLRALGYKETQREREVVITWLIKGKEKLENVYFS